MSYDPKVLGARCDSCPLNGQKPVQPHEAVGQRHFTMVLEGAGKVEPGAKMPAAGATGRFLARAFRIFGTDRRNIAIRNAMCCAPKAGTTDRELTTATEMCRPRLLRELQKTRADELVLACGDYALLSLAGRDSITAWRGYPHEALPDIPVPRTVFPVYHPAFVMRSNAYWPVWKSDLQRAIAHNAKRLPLWKWPRLEIDNDFGSFELLRIFQAAADKAPIRLGFDVETGGLSAFESPLLCLSLGGKGQGFDGSVSLTWPFADEQLDSATRHLLQHPNVTLELQNANHDLVTAHVNNLAISCKTHDLLPDSRVAFPQVNHDLYFNASVFHFIEPWKAIYGATGDAKGAESWLKRAQDPRTFRVMRRYNAQDGYATQITQPPLTAMLKRMS